MRKTGNRKIDRACKGCDRFRGVRARQRESAGVELREPSMFEAWSGDRVNELAGLRVGLAAFGTYDVCVSGCG